MTAVINPGADGCAIGELAAATQFAPTRYEIV